MKSLIEERQVSSKEKSKSIFIAIYFYQITKKYMFMCYDKNI